MHQWIAGAHLGQYLLGGNIPDQTITQMRYAFPYCPLDLEQELPERRLIRGVAGKHLGGERKPSR